MEKDELPRYSEVEDGRPRRRWRRPRHGPPRPVKLVILALVAYMIYSSWTSRKQQHAPQLLSIQRLKADHGICSKLQAKPQAPSGHRDRNDRYVEGEGGRPTLITNAVLWTGDVDPERDSEDNFTEADILMEHGLIKRVERGIDKSTLPSGCKVHDAGFRAVTAGIVDMHSHAGVDSLPELRGNEDTNELSSDITPYVRSLDGIQPLDHQIQVIKSGGVTTSLILPGSGNNIGGEAFVIKLAVGPADGRLEIAPEDMLADPERTWRYMKMACGENAKRVYGRVGRDFGPFSRLGEAWYFRHAFEQARKLVDSQDDWCAAADKIGAENMPEYFPKDLEWESLGAVLRGQVLVNTHCYTIPDLEAFVRHTNEFEFEIQAFHHAHQTYLVPEILKRAYGNHTPAAALFADNMYYKAEAYVGSEQAGKILYENGVTPVYVSDNPVINAQHVVFEAAKAYKNGLPYHVALNGVTARPAELLGLGHRIGKVKPGFDADVVVWDSDPMSVGSAPSQVWIDGVAQYEKPFQYDKPSNPQVLPPAKFLEKIPENATTSRDLAVTGISHVIGSVFAEDFHQGQNTTLVVRDGRLVCFNTYDNCRQGGALSDFESAEIIDLGGNGYITPPTVAFGSFLGMVEITGEKDTQDGGNGDQAFSAAIDGLAMDTKSLHAAYRHGVTRAITAPQMSQYGGHKGVSVGFNTGMLHAMEFVAIFEEEVAVHYTLDKSEKTPSLSSSIDALRTKLLKAVDKSKDPETLEEKSLQKVMRHGMPLVITVHSADMIASLLRMKIQLEKVMPSEQKLRLVIYGGAESHIVADKLAKTGTAVVLAPFQPYSESWDQRRSLTGPPLTNGTHLDRLVDAGVKVAIGTKEDWETRDLFLFAAIAWVNSGGRLEPEDAIALASSNVYEILGIERDASKDGGWPEFVVHEGNPLEIQSRVRVVADGSGTITAWT